MNKELKWLVLAVLGGVVGGIAYDWCLKTFGGK